MKMRTSKLAVIFAAGALATAPVVAQAAQRTSAPMSEESDLRGGSATWIGILATIAVVILAIVAATRDDNDPVSP
jgi:hypothetical protein